MTLWLLLTALCSAAAVIISVPLIRRYENNQNLSAAKGAAIYEDQAKEIERDLEAGTINTAEAEAAKTEVQRRLVQANKDVATVRPISPIWRTVALAACAALVILGSISLYGWLGNPELPSSATASAPPPQQQAAAQDNSATAPANNGAGQVQEMIAKLQARLQANPKDTEGWRMLGWAQFNTQRYQESADAYAKAAELDPNNADYKSAYAEALVQAAQGIVTPKAQDLIGQVLKQDPKEFRARFYDALAHEQSGDQAGALDRWIALLGDAPSDAGWRDDVKQRITELGKALGRDVSAALNATILPSLDQKPADGGEKDAMVAGMISKLQAKLEANPKDRDGWAMLIRSLNVTGDKKGAEEALAKALDIFKGDQATIDGLKSVMQAAAGQSAIPDSAAAPQISADQQAAVQAMPEGDQQAMIKSMVERLAGKLKENPQDMDGWIRLMRSYQVLKDEGKAKEALASALSAFATDNSAQTKLKAAASELGIN